jgi:hypothetical protein
MPSTSSVGSGVIKTYAIERITTTTNATLAPRIMAKVVATIFVPVKENNG